MKRAPRISVVTVTNRPGSIDILWDGLQQQKFYDFEWILCDELFDWRKREVSEYVNDSRLHHILAPQKEGDLWNLNKSYNEALRHCSGTFIVSLQDYIWIPVDGLAKYWDVYQRFGPRAFIAGVDSFYALPAPVHDSKGKITIFERPYLGKPTLQTHLGFRLKGERRIEEAKPKLWELNWSGAPLQAFYEIGGFCEKHDSEFYSCDNLTVAFCAQKIGYQFYIDKTNECYSIDHEGIFPKPIDWEKRHGKFGPWDQWYEEWEKKGNPRFPYLIES